MSPIFSKNELENSIFVPSLPGQKFFVRFLGELKNPKCSFEINSPLVSELVVRSGEQDVCDLNSGNLGGQLENHTMTSCSSLNSK